ncbi:MAG: GNAT family N-acetyltransferase [Planctomycetota bacterium]|jgi:ribosomal protein S18 acetylase RimI-like enzyme
MEAIEVRTAGEDDIEGLRALYTELDEVHARLLPDVFARGEEARPPAFIAERIAGADSAYLVAMTKAELIGSLYIYIRPPHPFPLLRRRRIASIDEIIVSEKHRREGTGRRLMEAGKTWAREKEADCLRITVWTRNREAKAFFEGVGFSNIFERMELPL